MILDSNVVIDIINAPQSAVTSWVMNNRPDRLYVNHIVFAEVSPSFAKKEELEGFLEALEIGIEPFDLATCFRAGRAFREYRRAGKGRASILPDFLIGAQAASRGWPLVTRDRKGFASYFPELTIIDPLETEI